MDRQALKLVHFSPVAIAAVQSRSQDDKVRLTGFLKPQGFWVSVDGRGGWEDWCMGERYQTRGLRYKYKISLSENANLLHIKSEEEFDEFEKEFLTKSLVPGMSEAITLREIDWSAVSNLYQGILIIPYLYSRRFGNLWYYGWDCASGCIWDASAIEELERVPKRLRR